MAATTTRINARDHERLRRIAEQTGQSQQEVLGRALESYEREALLTALDAAFGELQADTTAWAAELAERAAWDVTSTDAGADS